MSAENNSSPLERIAKQFLLFSSVIAIMVSFLAKVHFDIESRLQILELEMYNTKNNQDKTEKLLLEINKNILELTREINEKADKR